MISVQDYFVIRLYELEITYFSVMKEIEKLDKMNKTIFKEKIKRVNTS